MSAPTSMFTSLKTHNYRLWVSGQIVSLVGTWMQRVAQDWLVLELTDGNAFALGVVMALQFGPTLLLSAWGGVLADRYDKRILLFGTQVLMAACALILGLLNVTNVVTLWQVYVLALALGFVSAIDAPIRQSFTIEMVGPEILPNAMAINSMVFNMARIVGPAVAGYLIRYVGTGWVFLINVGSFAAVIIGLALMNPSELRRSERAPRAKGQVRAGFSYVWGRSDLRLLMFTVFMVSTFGLNFPISLALLARETFGRGAESYGLLSTMLAVGTLAGATMATRRTSMVRLRVFLGSAIAFGVFETITGFMPTYLAVSLILIPTGAMSITFTTAAMNIVQMSVDSSMRGRVMGIYMICFLGGTPLGSPLLGWLADVTNGRSPLIVGGVISLLTGLGCALYLVRHNRLSLHVHTEHGRPVIEVNQAAL